jgi:hypothetical protein
VILIHLRFREAKTAKFQLQLVALCVPLTTLKSTPRDQTIVFGRQTSVIFAISRIGKAMSEQSSDEMSTHGASPFSAFVSGLSQQLTSGQDKTQTQQNI